MNVSQISGLLWLSQTLTGMGAMSSLLGSAISAMVGNHASGRLSVYTLDPTKTSLRPVVIHPFSIPRAMFLCKFASVEFQWE